PSAPGPTVPPRTGVHQERVIRAIEEWGGTVERDERAPGRPVTAVFLNVPGIDDGDLRHLMAFPNLRRLSLLGTRITDEGLAHLRGLTGLRWLSLGGPRITDEGLAYLEGLTGVEELGLHDTRITDAGLVHLRRMTGLRILDLGGVRIT